MCDGDSSPVQPGDTVAKFELAVVDRRAGLTLRSFALADENSNRDGVTAGDGGARIPPVKRSFESWRYGSYPIEVDLDGEPVSISQAAWSSIAAAGECGALCRFAGLVGVRIS